MNQVRVDALVDGKAIPIGEVADFLPPGSVSSDEPDGTRRIYVFGWYDDDLGVWESHLGIDVQTDAVRNVISADLEKVSDLTEPYDLTIYRNGQPRHLRITACLERREAPGGA